MALNYIFCARRKKITNSPLMLADLHNDEVMQLTRFPRQGFPQRRSLTCSLTSPHTTLIIHCRLCRMIPHSAWVIITFLFFCFGTQTSIQLPLLRWHTYCMSARLQRRMLNVCRHLHSVCPQLSGLPNMIIVTDQECAITQALHDIFPSLQHFLCWNHILHPHTSFS